MRSAWRLRRLAGQGFLPRPLARSYVSSSASSSIPGEAEPQSSPIARDSLPHLNPPATTSRSNTFFTPSRQLSPSTSSNIFNKRPIASRIQPLTSADIDALAPSQARALVNLLPLLQQPLSDRTDIFSNQVWKVYRDLSPSVQRSLPPSIHKLVLRYVTPSSAHLEAMLGASVRPVAFRRAQAERLERRLQKVILDMRKSAPSPMRSDNADGMVLPHWSDYRYAMKKMSFLGWLSGSEGIYAEVKRFNWPLDIQRKLLYYRLASLTSWLRANTVHRITWRDGTTHVPLRVVRANEGEGEVSFKRVKGEQGEPRGPEELVGILRDSLKDLNADKSIRHGRTTDQLLEALRRMIAFLPSDQERLREATQQMLEEVLTRVHGLDLKYLTISPDSAVTRDVGSMVGVTNAVVDLLGSKGDVWRMVAAVDALGSGPDRLWSNSSWADEGESEEGWEDGSEVVMADAKRGGEGSRFLEEKGRSSKEIGKDAVDMVDAAGQAVETPSVLVDAFPQDPPPTARRKNWTDFAYFLSPIASPVEVVKAFAPALPAMRLPRPQLNNLTYTRMLHYALQTGPADLTLHILRSALRSAAEYRNEWLVSLLHAQKGGLSSELPGLPALSVSSQWFEFAHAAARKGMNSRWMADEVRELARREMMALEEEHLVLTGRRFGSTEDEGVTEPTLLDLYANSERADLPAVRLDHLAKTHWCLEELVELSSLQKAARTQVVHLANVRQASNRQARLEELAKEKSAKAERKAVKSGRGEKDDMLELHGGVTMA